MCIDVLICKIILNKQLQIVHHSCPIWEPLTTADVTTANVSTADVTTANVTTADVLVQEYGLWVRVWVRIWVRVWVRV